MTTNYIGKPESRVDGKLKGNNIVDSSELKNYDINDYNLETDLGVYLNREAYFRSPNTFICAVKKLEGYLDASGQQTNLNDKTVIVSAVLSTPFYWQEFNREWMKLLNDEKIPLESDQKQPVFYTAYFQNKNYPFRDKFGWHDTRYNNFYAKLIETINRRSLFSFAIAIDLLDYRKFINERPYAVSIFRSAGTFASILCFLKCAQYACKYKYDETISYVFDRNDTFSRELQLSYEILSQHLDQLKEWHFKVGGLTFGNKEVYTPIQAADVIAWEMSKHIKNAQIANLEIGQEMRSSFADLIINHGEFIYYSYESLLSFYTDYIEKIKAEIEIKQE